MRKSNRQIFTKKHQDVILQDMKTSIFWKISTGFLFLAVFFLANNLNNANNQISVLTEQQKNQKSPAEALLRTTKNLLEICLKSALDQNQKNTCYSEAELENRKILEKIYVSVYSENSDIAHVPLSTSKQMFESYRLATCNAAYALTPGADFKKQNFLDCSIRLIEKNIENLCVLDKSGKVCNNS